MNRKDILSYNTINLSLKSYFHIIFLLITINNITAQLKADFNSGSLSDLKWDGNISHFKINVEGQLQLNAAGAGESQIYTKFKVPNDSIQIDLYFKLQFAPSNDNYGKIYLFTDNVIESSANGYYLRLGENGTNDAIQVWKLEQGLPRLLGSGKLGAISGDPAEARIRCKVYRDGFWIMSTDYNGKFLFEDDLEFYDPSLMLTDSLYFGLYCKYTSTRADKFFYDDISFITVEKDTIAPAVISATVIDESTIKLIFSEGLEESSAKNILFYSADNGLGSPDQAIFVPSLPNEVTLKFNTKMIKSGISYTLMVNGVKDKSNNVKQSEAIFLLTVKPTKGDLVLSEVLTDPYTDGDDFIELYNISDKFLKLDSLTIKNAQKNESKVIRTDFILLPGKYVAISRDIDFLKNTYNPPDTSNFITATLPSLNVEGANISIISNVGIHQITIDSFDYSEKFHFQLIDNTKGVSLEKLNLYSNTNDPNNWHSATAQVKYATPGYKNSTTITPNNTPSEFGITLDKRTFTPDGDNVDDFLLINYKMQKPGFLATIRIFDAEGFPQTDLVSNYLLGTEGAIKWDGIDGEGKIMRMGLYVIFTRLFHTDGDVLEFKNVVVVANRF